MVLLLLLVSIPHFPRAGVNCLPSVVFDPNHLTQLSRQLHLISCLNLNWLVRCLLCLAILRDYRKDSSFARDSPWQSAKHDTRKPVSAVFRIKRKNLKITSNYGEASDDFVSTIDYCRLLPRLMLTWNYKSNDVEKRPKLATNQLQLAHGRSAFSVVEGPSDVR